MSKIICGKNSVFDIVKNKSMKIKELYVTKQTMIKGDFDFPIKVVEKSFLNEITKLNHQGIVAIIDDDFQYSNWDKLKKEKPEIVLVLDHIEDPQNLGAIIRTANASGVKFIIIPDKRAAQVNDTVLKVSSGGFVGMYIIRVSSLQIAIEKLKELNYWIYASALDDKAKVYFDINYSFPLAIVVGNEGKGVSSTLKKASDEIIYIPMNGSVQSLNVSVATGILLFDVTKKRPK